MPCFEGTDHYKHIHTWISKWYSALSVKMMTWTHDTATQISPDRPPNHTQATGNRSPSPPASAHTHTMEKRWCSKTEWYREEHVLTRLPPSLPCLNTQLNPSLYFSVFFTSALSHSCQGKILFVVYPPTSCYQLWVFASSNCLPLSLDSLPVSLSYSSTVCFQTLYLYRLSL